MGNICLPKCDETSAKRVKRVYAIGVHRLQQQKKVAPVGSFEYYKDLVFQLSANVTDVEVKQLGQHGEIGVYMEVDYLDGIPSQALCDYIKEQLNSPEYRCLYDTITFVAPMSELKNNGGMNDASDRVST